ncbi:MAG: helicase [Planctomycetes bacterium]|nr:helicase [Planctomycetota bacterium]
MTVPKPFQEATVDAVMSAFRVRRRVRRFLVADEVGLGKTVVAQHVIRRMTIRRERPLVVFYLCSNLAIARQNRRKLLEVIPSNERYDADCQVDRLSLLPAYERPSHPRLHLYSLTPDTSIPIRRRQSRDGRQEERALVHALVERAWPHFFTEWNRNVFQRSATVHWTSTVRQQRGKAGNTALREAFVRSVRQEFNLQPYQQLLPVLRDLDHLELIAHLRNALAASAVEEVQPDLVIFDEFQRFRDLLNPDIDEAERRVIGRLRGDDVANPPALLLLSATPYRFFSRRWEDEAGASHRSEFFELVEFLYGGDGAAKQKRQQCEDAFLALETELRKGQPKSSEAQSARRNVEQLLRPIMARTERASHDDGWADLQTETIEAEVAGADLAIFKHMCESFDDKHRSSAVPYWTSIPLPMQTMGTHYVAWKSARSVESDGAVRVDEAMRDRFECPELWPHPRLRALRELVPTRQLGVPWLPPTAPWWSLRGIWKDERHTPSKILLFSRFRAVPQAIAAALSFDLESATLGSEKLGYADVTRRRLLAATEGRQALLGLFHPSPLLVEATEPLTAKSQRPSDVRREIRHQIKRMLTDLGVVVRDRAPHLPMWRLLARLENRAGMWHWISNNWWVLLKEIRKRKKLATSDEDAGLAQLLRDWDAEASKPIEVISHAVFNELVEHAFGAPGVVIGRALRRHWIHAVDEGGFFYTLDATWTGLRNYLDQRWFYSVLRRGSESYPEAIQRAVVEGNLEAVLDEHLWITSRLRSLSEEDLAEELRDGFSIKSGLFFLHPLGDKNGDTFSLRCHVALPFVQARVASLDEHGEKPIRTDELRRAFNTPFWPYVVATTSVGQEGLDFHTWCDTLVHWDLCRNPVDLEQREGRIQRFGGLSIRRSIAKRLAAEAFDTLAEGTSPWTRIEELANATMSDESGLAPWWVCPDAGVKRYVFDVPTSEQKHWLHWVHEQRLLYRLALGQPTRRPYRHSLQQGNDATKRSARCGHQSLTVVQSLLIPKCARPTAAVSVTTVSDPFFCHPLFVGIMEHDRQVGKFGGQHVYAPGYGCKLAAAE